jgi:DNA-binding GntR family transcriptional regulator
MTTTAPGTVGVAGGGPARDRVYAWLRDGIISGALEGGRFLDELWVSGVVGVSRTPVREAFHRLEAERFISLLPRKGAQVRTVTARELEEVYQSRRLIEGHALGEVCAARAGAPAEMAGLIEEMDRAGKDRDWFAVSGLDRQFHRAIVNAAGNTVLTELYDTLRSRQQRVTVRALEARPERLSIIAAEHRQLVAAIDAHEAAVALRLLNEHLYPVPEVVSALERA